MAAGVAIPEGSNLLCRRRAALGAEESEPSFQSSFQLSCRDWLEHLWLGLLRISAPRVQEYDVGSLSHSLAIPLGA